VLERAGLVKVEKEFEGRRPRTWLSATRRGREGLAAELRALRELIEQVNGEFPQGLSHRLTARAD
jgi:DNA-binding PadR family transcriptional regulator